MSGDPIPSGYGSYRSAVILHTSHGYCMLRALPEVGEILKHHLAANAIPHLEEFRIFLNAGSITQEFGILNITKY